MYAQTVGDNYPLQSPVAQPKPNLWGAGAITFFFFTVISGVGIGGVLYYVGPNYYLSIPILATFVNGVLTIVCAGQYVAKIIHSKSTIRPIHNYPDNAFGEYTPPYDYASQGAHVRQVPSAPKPTIAGSDLLNYTGVTQVRLYPVMKYESDFINWALNSANSCNHAILSNTLMQSDDRAQTISYSWFSRTDQAGKESIYKQFLRPTIMEQHLPPLQKVGVIEEWYGYSVEDAGYVIFANEKTIGGDCLNSGVAQEAAFFFSCPALIYWKHYMEKNQIPIHTGRLEDFPTPYVVFDLNREFALDPELYGRKTREFSSEKIASCIHRLKQQPTVHGIAINAKNLKPNRQRHVSRYTGETLMCDLISAYLGFLQYKNEMVQRGKQPVVYTGAWGCGAYGNDPKTMVILQLLAARLAGVDIVFTGVGKDLGHHPTYTKACIREAIDFVQSAELADTALDDLLADLKRRGLA